MISMITHSQRGETKDFDVIVFGGGLSGLSFCLELTKLKPTARIALISKSSIQESNSYYAQGGIASVSHSEDSFDQHINDTLKAGAFENNKEATDSIIQAGPNTIESLKGYGVAFDMETPQKPHLCREGGHSQRRILHVGDQTGKAIVTTLLKKTQDCPNITFFEFHTGVNLLVKNPQTSNALKEIVGAYVLEEKTGLIHTFFSKVVILATGGAGKTYRYTTNPDVATGDGVAMAYRAGARIENMEFYQFHPTLLYHQECSNFLISEAMRGEGAYLRSVDNEERFMRRYAPEKMELATRDIVARAIFTEIERSAHKYVYLDVRHQNKADLQKRFPNIYQTLLNLKIDISQDMIPVVPAAHYMCGGIVADVNGQTDLHRLFAIGEVAFTGLHGANRLASNSLLEAFVVGKNAARHTLSHLEEKIAVLPNSFHWDSESVIDLRRASQINAHWRGLRGEMTSYAGIIRTETGLRDLLQLITTRKQMIEEYYWRYSITRDLVELRNIICVAELIVRGALARNKSCGVHYREDDISSKIV